MGLDETAAATMSLPGASDYEPGDGAASVSGGQFPAKRVGDGVWASELGDRCRGGPVEWNANTTVRLHTGQLVTVDGAAGTVTPHDNPAADQQ
jgi:hypothetical protein